MGSKRGLGSQNEQSGRPATSGHTQPSGPQVVHVVFRQPRGRPRPPGQSWAVGWTQLSQSVEQGVPSALKDRLDRHTSLLPCPLGQNLVGV